MIRRLIIETYGGKIDDEGDYQELTGLVWRFLTPNAYEIDHVLVEDAGGVGGLTVPSGTSMKDFTDWVHKLPEREPPTYLGLPANAEKLLLVDQGKNLIQNVWKVTELLDESEQVMAEA